MAIDFMMMPLSRYIAGDFITPQMRFAWESGVQYTLLSRDGPRSVPRDTPFGGPTAAAERNRVQAILAEDLAAMPLPIPACLWDERSDVEPRFYRVDAHAWTRLAEDAAKPVPSHLGATLWLPCDFDAVFNMTSPWARRVGSVGRALAELDGWQWSPAARLAVETLRAALAHAASARLPMIVDT